MGGGEDFIEKPRFIIIFFFLGGGGYYKKCLIQRYETQITAVLRRTSLVYEDTEEIKRKTNSPTMGLRVYKSPNFYIIKLGLLLTLYRNYRGYFNLDTCNSSLSNCSCVFRRNFLAISISSWIVAGIIPSLSAAESNE